MLHNGRPSIARLISLASHFRGITLPLDEALNITEGTTAFFNFAHMYNFDWALPKCCNQLTLFPILTYNCNAIIEAN